jgi:hypothetical protein
VSALKGIYLIFLDIGCVYGPLGLILGFIMLLDLNLWATIVILHELSSQSPLSPSHARVKFSVLEILV